jgi:photosystem II stability/assembly factor-like uncharacterized protein
MRRKSQQFYLIVLFAGFVLLPPSCLAGPNRWTASGPAVSEILNVIVDPDDATHAYAITIGAGIYKTEDGGETWRAANEGLSNFSVSALIVRPDAPATLYAATDGGIFISTDAGEHWRQQSNLQANLAVDPVSAMLYATTPTAVLTSIDGGDTWSSPISFGHYISSLAVGPTGTAYFVSSGLFRSTDKGRTWVEVDGSPALVTSEVCKIAIDRESGAIYLSAGTSVFTSADNAESWTLLPSIQLGSEQVAVIKQVIPAGAGHVFAASESGLFEFNDRSGKWISIASGSVRALAISSTTPRRLYAAHDFGLLTRREEDAAWRPANSGLPGVFAFDVAVIGSDPNIAYAATSAGVFKTKSGGKSWEKIRGGASITVAVSPVESETAYVSTSVTANPEIVPLTDGIVKTTDGGATWTKVKPDFASVLAVAPTDPATLYAALFGLGMSKSIDGGTTWSTIMVGLPHDFGYVDFFYGWSASSVAVDPTNSSTAYLGKTQGLFKTTDGGNNWNQVSNMSNPQAIAIDAGAPSTLYAAANGVMKSADGGQTWTGAGLIDKLVSSLTISRTSPPVLYAGTNDGYVYSSRNGGDYWSSVEGGLSASVSRLAVDPSGSYLYAATTAGVHEYHFVIDDTQIRRLPDDPLRLSRLFDQLLGSPNNSGFVLPVVGTATGVGGNLFASEVTLSNNRALNQDVLLAWLPRAYGASLSSFLVTLPAASDASGGALKITDVAERLGISGIGSLAVFALGSGGDLDTNASIDGASRIWLHPADRRAPFSQSIPAVRASLFSEHVRANSCCFEHDNAFRTNVGVVNLSGELHQFTIQFNGQRASGQITIAVPPFSLVQVPVPSGDYGPLSLAVFADTSTRWLFYGSTINNITEEAQTTVGNPSGSG